MRIEARVVAVSWIPSEAVKGMMKAPFEMGLSHYDEAPPEVLGDLDDWKARDLFRVANDLRAWIDVADDGSVTAHGYSGGGVIGSTTIGLGSAAATFQAVGYPDLQQDPEVGDGWVRFQQTAGGRTGVPAPRRVSAPPYVQYHAPTAWSTLAPHHPRRRARRARDRRARAPSPATGSTAPTAPCRPRRASSTSRTGTATRSARTRRGAVRSRPPLVAELESALERQLSQVIMGRGQAQGPQAQGGGHAHQAGRGGRRDLPAARRRRAGRGRRRARWPTSVRGR